MPTVGEVYGPLVDAAVKGDTKGHDLLQQAGANIWETNPHICTSLEQGVEAAKRNLDYYCQYYSEEIAAKVKEFYNLGAGYRFLI